MLWNTNAARRRSCLIHTLSALVPLAAATLSAAGAPAQAAARSAAQAEGRLAVIVVTARRRREDVQNVPIAMTALDNRELRERDITSLTDLTSLVPNIKISADRATSNTINVYIRGVGQSDPLWGFDPSVGVYIDDVYLARPQAALLDVYDVQRIEVLRGPQGTLYGKNTIAGAIKYVTRDIAGPASLRASVTGGTYGERDVKLSGSMPVIADHLYVGLAAADVHHDGYGHVVAQTGVAPSPYNAIGQDVSSYDVLAARANVTATWGASSKLVLSADTTQNHSNASGGQRLTNAIAPALDSRYDTRTDMPVNQDRYFQNGLAAIYTQDLNDRLALKVIGAYREGHGRQFIDFAELDANLFEVPAMYRERQASGEAKLTFTSDLVKAIGGVFFMNSSACGAYNASIGALVPIYDLYLTSLVDGCVQTRSTAVYGDTTWKLTDRLNFDVGVRWNEDRKTAQVYQAQYASVAPTQLLPNQTFFDASSPPAGFFLFPSAAAGVLTNYSNSRTFPNVSPRVEFDYHLTPRVMSYVSYSRGFKSGGFDMRGNAAIYPQTENGYGSEIADNYEVGMKSTLRHDTLLFDLTLFYNPYKNAQIGVQQFVVSGGIPQNVTAVLNAGKQINQGVEIESAWKPIAPLTLNLSVGYLDSYYQDFLVGCTALTAGCAANSPPQNIADQNRPINAPTWTLSTNAMYTWMLQGGDLLARVGWDWRSFTKVANTTPSVTDQPAYGLVNAGLAYTTQGGAWRFAVDGKNLFNRWYRVAGYDFGSAGLLGGYSQIGFYGAPRTFDATVEYHY
ncbi:MAG TPA: TonB-dependent receptor [Steroidobacteraceae bacterium]|nr:TonB-dependent receptor [Steroidobacteraceae bacterium]